MFQRSSVLLEVSSTPASSRCWPRERRRERLLHAQDPPVDRFPPVRPANPTARGAICSSTNRPNSMNARFTCTFALLLVLFAMNCTIECDPFIVYDDETPGVEGRGCPRLEFEETPTPLVWYPIGTRASVRECHNNNRFLIREFECLGDNFWYEFRFL